MGKIASLLCVILIIYLVACVSDIETIDPITIEIGEFSLPNGDSVEMVYVPEGTFTMGIDGESSAAPKHEVYLDAYWIDRTEVTNQQYEACVDDGDCGPPELSNSYHEDNYFGNPEFDTYPVIHVVWNDAKSYCQWRGARLPTEAEWEKAARGVDGRSYPWGEEYDCELANGGGSGIGDTVSVGSYPDGASPYGALDMAGNVEEWTADWLDGDYYTVSPASNPEGPEKGWVKVKRGGDWFNYYTRLVTYKRAPGNPSYFIHFTHGFTVGFRCASSPDGS